MANSKITVVIPCYNAENYIVKCFDKLNVQTYRDFDVVIVDDCSTDKSYEKILSVKDNYDFNVSVVKNEKNSGPAISRNVGVKIADGEYIAFCDSDDYYEPNFLEIMLSELIDNDAELAFCGYSVVNEKGEKENRPLPFDKQPENIKESLKVNCDSLCMMLVKADIIKKTPLPDLRNGEDMAVVPLLVQKANKVRLISDCLYNYYRRSGSASQKPSMPVVESLIKSFNYLKDNFDKKYYSELEFIGIKNLLYSAEITLFSVGYKRKTGKKILTDFEKDFPRWYKNDGIKALPSYKKMVLKLLKMRFFFTIRIVALIRSAKIK